MRTIIFVLCLIAFSACYDYGDQDNWPGQCQTGLKQSPINIDTRNLHQCPHYWTFYIYAPNHTYIQTPKQAQNLFTQFQLSTITFKNKTYKSLQFHFHRSAEHTVNNDQLSSNKTLELHILHEGVDVQGLAVYGIRFRVQQGLKEDVFDRWDLNPSVDTKQYFPIRLSTPGLVYHYSGSLTSPSKPQPCDQVVQWFVDRDVIPIKQSSFDKMKGLIYTGFPYGNNRRTQPLNKRTVYEVGQMCNPQVHQRYLRRHD